MMSRLTGLREQLSSRWLASAFLIVYLLVSGTVGVGLLTAPKPPDQNAIPMASTPPFTYTDTAPLTSMTRPTAPQRDDSAPTTTPSPPSSTAPATPAAPAGYQRVSGPAGLRTVIPQGWASTHSSGPGAMQAVDPRQDTRYVKYGGAAAPTVPIDTSHIQYENGFAIRAMEYRRIALSTATYGGHNAVEWEFEHRDAGTYLHVRSLYWRTNGTEYFLLAAAPAGQWADMKPIYDTMVAHASP